MDNQCLRDLLPKVPLVHTNSGTFSSPHQVASGPNVPPCCSQQEARHVLHLVCNVKGAAKTPETSARVRRLCHEQRGGLGAWGARALRTGRMGVGWDSRGRCVLCFFPSES